MSSLMSSMSLRCRVVGKSCVAFVGQSFEKKGKETQEIQKKITQSEQKTVQGKEMCK